MLTANEARRADRETTRQLAEFARGARGKWFRDLVFEKGRPVPELLEAARDAALTVRELTGFRAPLSTLIREEGTLALSVGSRGREFVRQLPRVARRLSRDLRRPLFPSDVTLLCDYAFDACEGGRVTWARQ